MESYQLVAVNRNDSLIAEYAYDHAGLWYLKKDIVAGKTAIYVYDTGTELMYEEVYSNSNLNTPISKTSYLNTGSKRIAKIVGSAFSYYYYTNHLGSTRLVMTGGRIKICDCGKRGYDFKSHLIYDRLAIENVKDFNKTFKWLGRGEEYLT